MPARKVFAYGSFLVLGAALAAWLAWPPAGWALPVVLPLFALGWHDFLQRRQTIKRNFPLIGRGRYWMEVLRPKIYQYFVESDINGRPFDRGQRSVIYQRAKRDLDTTPFGTKLDVYEVGYEWMAHSIAPTPEGSVEHSPRVGIGGADCKAPYSASLLNISAMSFGALSANAVRALNKGARLGGFYHNTGEGSASPYHLEQGGDLVWQVGTGYFGCRTLDGAFDPARFKDTAARPAVKMVELKLSQGAKPGHGGILPAAKNTPEIAAMRGVTAGTKVLSPAGHRAFSTPAGLLEFIARLRELSGGKPVGFKLCVGKRSEFTAICKAMLRTGIRPDFITVDGGEGGTGAAPVEFSNAVGLPLREGLAFVHDALTGCGLRKEVRVIASGKVVTGFDIVRVLALGADLCNSARGMMFALGCIQALECNSNTCPTGITTQDPWLSAGLDVDDKAVRVRNFHAETVKSAAELFAAAGFRSPGQVRRHHVFRRVSPVEIRRLDQIYPDVPEGSFLGGDVPERYREVVARADPDTFEPRRAR